MDHSIDGFISGLRKQLEEKKDAFKAPAQKKYLKSPYNFYGVSVWEINNIVLDFRKQHPTLEKDKLFKIVDKLWRSNYHEEKTLALKLLSAYTSYLSLKDMDLLESLLKTSAGWDHVDEISCHLVSAILLKNKKSYEYLKKWSKSDNLWMRRASMISQILLFRDNKGNKQLFFDIAKEHLTDKDFFIRKAIGWTLREMSKSDASSVYEFLKSNQEMASGLTIREGARKLPDNLRKEFLHN